MLPILAAILIAGTPVQQSPPPPPNAMPGEEAIDPYVADNANAGARPFPGDAMAMAFHGQPGIRRIVDTFVALNFDDKVVGDVFRGLDRARIGRTVFEQFCYILNAGCDYTGRDIKSAHKDLGIQQADMNRVVENLQAAMRKEGVSFAAQNRFMAKLAPMRRDVVTR